MTFMLLLLSQMALLILDEHVPFLEKDSISWIMACFCSYFGDFESLGFQSITIVVSSMRRRGLFKNFICVSTVKNTRGLEEILSSQSREIFPRSRSFDAWIKWWYNLLLLVHCIQFMNIPDSTTIKNSMIRLGLVFVCVWAVVAKKVNYMLLSFTECVTSSKPA
jgi:hypothetical protein